LSACEDFNVIIPVKNEALGLKMTLEELLNTGVSRDKIIVVDGGSTDGSREIAKNFKVKLIDQKYPGGKAGGVRTGLEVVEASYAVIIDGDYTYPASHIWDLCKKASEGYDMVIGVRIPEPNSTNPILRLGNWLLTKWFNLIFGTRLRDVLSGMYLIRIDTLREAEWETKGFSIESEIVAHIASLSGRISEVPISYRRRIEPEKKKLKVLDGFKIATDIVKLSWSYNPVFTLFIVASLILIPGLFLDLYYLYHYSVNNVKYYMKGLMGVIMTLMGFQSLALAILSLYLKRVELRLRRSIEVALRRQSRWQ